MKVSVVIPLFNKRLYVARAVESVLSQSMTDFGLIIVDDGSTDGSADIVAEYKDPRIRLIRQANAGTSAARNRGIAEAQTELIAFLDADDTWTTQLLETIMRLSRRFPNCGAYATAYEILEPTGRRWQPRFRDVPPAPWEGIFPNYFRSAMGTPPICSSAVAVPKGIFAKTGLFPVGEGHGEDLDTWCRIALAFPIAFSHMVGAVYRRDAAGRACERDVALHDYVVIRTLSNALPDKFQPTHSDPGYGPEDLVEYRNKLLIGSASACVAAGLAGRARERLAGAAQTREFRRQWWYWYMLSWMPKSVLRGAQSCKRSIVRLRHRSSR
jgi:glycosyltransferase involved in cell wall biosynthesis